MCFYSRCVYTCPPAPVLGASVSVFRAEVCLKSVVLGIGRIEVGIWGLRQDYARIGI